MNVGESLLVGVDVGGTRIAMLVASLDGMVLGRATAPSAGDQDRAAEAIGATVEMALAAAGGRPEDVAVVGVGVPGRVEPQTGRLTITVNGTDIAAGRRPANGVRDGRRPQG